MQRQLETKSQEHAEDGYPVPPRIDEAAALAESAEMADRFNRLFLRTLRALRDLRRYAPSVTIQNLGGQVNVAGQQVVANR